jgi:hypothetical protein
MDQLGRRERDLVIRLCLRPSNRGNSDPQIRSFKGADIVWAFGYSQPLFSPRPLYNHGESLSEPLMTHLHEWL